MNNIEILIFCMIIGFFAFAVVNRVCSCFEKKFDTEAYIAEKTGTLSGIFGGGERHESEE